MHRDSKGQEQLMDITGTIIPSEDLDGDFRVDVHDGVFTCESKEEKSANVDTIYRMLAGPAGAEMEEFVAQWRNPDERVEYLAKDMPEVFSKVAEASNEEEGPSETSLALKPTIADSLRLISQSDKPFLTEILSPVIGSATSKYFTDTTRHIMRQVNRKSQIIFSPRVFLWLFQSLVSRKSFSEILHDQTSGYEVESIYVIDPRSFEPIAGTEIDEAIQSLSIFQDHKSEDYLQIREHLDGAKLNRKSVQNIDLQISMDRTAIVLEGTSHILAAVVNGAMSGQVVDTLQEVVDEIDHGYGKEIQEISYDEDISSELVAHKLQGLDAALKKGMITKGFESESGDFSGSKLMYLIIASGILFLLGFQFYQEYKWNHFVEDLEGKNGITITQNEKSWGERKIRGIKDPSAIDPAALAKEHGLNPEDITFTFATFLSGSEEFAGPREAKTQDQIAALSQRIDEEIQRNSTEFSAKLEGQEEQFTDALRDSESKTELNTSRMIQDTIVEMRAQERKASVRKFRSIHQLPEQVETKLEGDTIVLAGTLPESEYNRAIAGASLVYTVNDVDHSKLVNANAKDLENWKNQIEAIRIPFVSGTPSPERITNQRIKEVYELYSQIKKTAERKSINVQLDLRAIPLVGKNVEGNRIVVEKRALHLKREFSKLGLPSRELRELQWDPIPESISAHHRGLYVTISLRK